MQVPSFYRRAILLLLGLLAGCSASPVTDDDEISPTPSPTRSPGPSISVAPTALDFGPVLVSEIGTAQFTISNVGLEDLSVTNLTFAGDSGDMFLLEGPSPPYAIPPDEATVVTLEFVPTDKGYFTDRLIVHSNDPEYDNVPVAMLGQGFLPTIDEDEDGYDSEEDCNDLDPAIHPLADEGVDSNGDGILEADGIDNDCDGIIDEGTDSYDDDGDGYTELEGDCADHDPGLHPDAPEGEDTNEDGFIEGDGIDNNCNGIIDEGTSLVDADEDGFTAPQGDCDDLDPDIRPDAPEGPDTNGDGVLEHDGIDNNCNGIIDEGTDKYDDDGDAFTELMGDCDDSNPDIWPAASEGGKLGAPNGIDDDCDGLVDEDFVEANEVVVSELMVEPSASSGQYVELYNTSDRPIDLTGWDLTTSTGTLIISPESSVVVEPGEVVLLAASTDPEVNGGLEPDVVLAELTLLVPDLLQLGIPGLAVDTLTWNSSWPFGPGGAMTLDSNAQDAGDNDSAEAWCSAQESYGDGDFGTPGEVNGPCPEATPSD